ncbi:MAG: hypothetical protein K6G52_00195 [Treponemataceae bacterium]|nr:hypothetical protein [Treponemataceae bacterium]
MSNNVSEIAMSEFKDAMQLSLENSGSFFHSSDIPNGTKAIISIKVVDVLTDEDEVYNEELLAQLRKDLIEAQPFERKFLFLPVYENLDYQTVTAAMRHTARRLKKFESIAGFVLPQNEEFKNEKVRQYFIDELSEKHPDYKYYSL